MEHSSLLTRRGFLLRGIQVTATLPLVGAAGWGGFTKADGDERILVVVQLTGGNDGLNTVVPLEQDAYFRSRPVLSQVAARAHRVSDRLSFHPSLARFATRVRDGRAAVVHSVGVDTPDRSHFHSMAMWHAGLLPSEQAQAPDRAGWLGRAARQLEARRPGAGLALHVGRTRAPASLLQPGRAPLRLTDPDALRIAARDADERRLAQAQGAAARSQADSDLAYLANNAEQANDLQRRLEAATGTQSRIPYPQTRLAGDFELVARLIRGGLGASIYSVELDGFDTHLDQPKTHAYLLERLDGALDAFLQDLESDATSKRVAVLVFSEFGRRAFENQSAGTDHGAAGPAFLLGDSLAANSFGTPPDLGRLTDGDVPATTDFRSLQQSISSGWLGLPSSGERPQLELFTA